MQRLTDSKIKSISTETDIYKLGEILLYCDNQANKYLDNGLTIWDNKINRLSITFTVSLDRIKAVLLNISESGTKQSEFIENNYPNCIGVILDITISEVNSNYKYIEFMEYTAY